jgi:hypothetical protein
MFVAGLYANVPEFCVLSSTSLPSQTAFESCTDDGNEPCATALDHAWVRGVYHQMVPAGASPESASTIIS